MLFKLEVQVDDDRLSSATERDTITKSNAALDIAIKMEGIKIYKVIISKLCTTKDSFKLILTDLLHNYFCYLHLGN